MATSISVLPVGFTTISPVAFPLLSSSTPITVATTTSPATTASLSSLVDLSFAGQVLSAVSTTESQLSGLQSTSTPATPESVQATAERLVASFNTLQDSVAGLQSLFDTAADALPAPALSPTLNDLAATALATASSTFDSLLGIGIQTVPSPTTGAPLLTIDQPLLDAASAADPAATQGLLDQAIGVLSDLLTDFETQAASAALNQATLTQAAITTTPTVDQSPLFGLTPASPLPGAALATDLLQNLTPDTVLNDVQLTDLDLAATGVDGATLLTNPAVLQNTLTTEQLAANGVAELATEILLPATDELLTTSPTNPPAIGTPPAAESTTVAATPLPAAVPTATVTTAAAVGTAAAATNTDALAADRRASDATIALRNLLANSVTRSTDLQLDPVYAALIASVRLSDFVAPTPLLDPAKLAAEFPEAVAPTERVHAVEEQV